MELVRIYRNSGDKIILVTPSPRARREVSRVPSPNEEDPDIVVMETDQELLDRVCKKAEDKGLLAERNLPPNAEHHDLYQSQLPKSSREKWKWDDTHPNKVKEDMTVITQAEKRQAVQDSLDAELAEIAPNPVVAMRLFRDLQTGNF